MTGCPIATITDIIEEFWLTQNGFGSQASAMRAKKGHRSVFEIILRILTKVFKKRAGEMWILSPCLVFLRQRTPSDWCGFRWHFRIGGAVVEYKDYRWYHTTTVTSDWVVQGLNIGHFQAFLHLGFPLFISLLYSNGLWKSGMPAPSWFFTLFRISNWPRGVSRSNEA